MKETNFSYILAACLDSIERGEHTLEECLALYPEHRHDLEALLSIAGAIRERADFNTRPGFQAASRSRLLRQLKPRPSGISRQTSSYTGQRVYPAFSRRLAVLWTTILILALSLSTVGTAYASSAALPGDVLYPVKISIEDARLWLSDDAGDVLLATRFMQVRMDEIQALINSDREEDLDHAVNLLGERIDDSTESLGAVVQDDPERAARLSSVLEETLSSHSQTLTSQLEIVPDQARPAIEHAIIASNKGREAVQELFENELPGGDPPDGIPGPGSVQPGGPPDVVPGPASTPPSGGPPDGVPDPPSTHPGGGPTNDSAGPPTAVPGNRP